MTQSEALNILKTGANVFLTGEPGSGKSYTINQYVSYLKEHGIAYAVTASTGIAATHIGGMTIHSWSGLGIRDSLTSYELDALAQKEYVAKRIQKAKVLIIDEISMLGCTMLDTIDSVCKAVKGSAEPFGGLQVVLVGDFFQLPPIVRKSFQNFDEHNQEFDEEADQNMFAFSGTAWKQTGFVICYLSEQHRQEDDQLLEILSIMRSGDRAFEIKELLDPHIKTDRKNLPPITKLYSHNINVDVINKDSLTKLPGLIKTFKMEATGNNILIENLKKGCLSPEVLELKVGAKVMCTKNNPTENYMNGTMGEVVSFDNGVPVIKTAAGQIIAMKKAEWMIEEDGKVKASLSQFPLRLAWAITIHKSQGMSLDSAIMDLSSVFEYGQGYVALSRVRTLKGIHLLGFNERSLEVHPRVVMRDEAFKIASDVAQDEFNKFSPDDLQQMHTNFILASGGTLLVRKHKDGTINTTKVNTVRLTYDLLCEGFSLSEIAKKRNMVIGTIMTHIETILSHPDEYILEKKVIEQAIDAKLKKNITALHKVFIKMESLDSLKYIFEITKGKYTYDEIKVAKLLMK